MKKCPHGGEVLGLELTDFDLRIAIENALILVREQASRRGIAPDTRAPVSHSRCRDSPTPRRRARQRRLRARAAAWAPRLRTTVRESSRTPRRAPAQRRTSTLSARGVEGREDGHALECSRVLLNHFRIFSTRFIQNSSCAPSAAPDCHSVVTPPRRSESIPGRL